VLMKATAVAVAFFLPFLCYTSKKDKPYRRKTTYEHESPEYFDDIVETFAIVRPAHLLRMKPKRKAPSVSRDDYREDRDRRKVSAIRRKKKQRKYRMGRKIKFKKRRKK